MMKFRTSDEVNLAYYDNGEGIPVIFIAGYGAAAETWFSQQEAFQQAGYRAILLDRRSHGYSDNPSYGHRLSRHAVDLYEFIEYLGAEKVILVGQSMGASTIYAYLSLFGDKKLYGAVSVDQTPKMLNVEGWNYGMYGLDKETMAVFFDKPIPSPFGRMPDEAFMKILGEKTREVPAFDEAGTKPLLLDHAYSSWLDVLPRVSVPFLFIAGKDSPFWPSAHAQAAARMCQAGEYTVIENCGHAVNWEQPEECNGLLLQFAGKIGGRS